MKTIGIIGGGQLAKMLSVQAHKLGFRTVILEKNPEAPALNGCRNIVLGSPDDKESLKKFSEKCDIITLENEFVSTEALEYLEGLGNTVLPGSNALGLIQDKLMQKKRMNENGLACPKYMAVEDNYEKLVDELGLPFVLKSRYYSYDGTGNYLVENEGRFRRGVEKLSERKVSGLFAEEFVNFDMELAVQVVISKDDRRVYPVVETVQKNHVCTNVISPAPVSKEVEKRASEIALKAVESVDGFGVYAVEMFLAGQDIMVNELAPRVHNSGHYTIEGCKTSQFENHIRAITGLPLGSTEMTGEAAVMVNILGVEEREFKPTYQNIGEKAHIHVYGKKMERKGRKMGHVIIVGKNPEKLLNMAEDIVEGMLKWQK